MTVFIGVGILACIAGMYTKLWGRRFEEVLPLSMFSVIFLIYLTGMFKSLQAGFWLTLAAGGIGGLCCLYFSIKEKRKFLQQVLTPGCIAFFLLAFIFWWTNRGRLLMQWDDFSHWGLVVKNMHLFQKLGNVAESTVKFKDYPPAASIFAYFFTNFGSYNETNAIRGMGLLTAGTMLPLFREIRWENKKSLFSGMVLFTLIYVLPTSFHKNAYIGLYVDSLLGVLFFFLVYLMVAYEPGKFRTVNLAAGCMMLTLTKASGTGLAMMAVCFVLIGFLFVYKEKRERLRLFADGAVCVASVVLAQQSWNLYLKFSGTERAWSASEISPAGILALFTGEAPAYRMETLKNFGSFLLTKPMGGWLVQFPVIVWIVLFVAFAFLFLCFCEEEDRKRFRAVFIGLMAGFLVYLLSLLILYLFSYSQFEAVKLASADRYIFTYILGMLCSYVGIFVLYFREKQLLVHILALVVTSLCVTKDGVFDVLMYPKESVLTSQMLEEGYRGSGRFQDKLDGTKDRVYVISQNNYGLDYWVLRNVFTPVKINDNYTWSIGESYGDGDVFTAYKDIYSWSEDLKQFDYVYLFRVDDQFRQQFGELFENPEDIENDTMFTVTYEGDLAHLILNEEMTRY